MSLLLRVDATQILYYFVGVYITLEREPTSLVSFQQNHGFFPQLR